MGYLSLEAFTLSGTPSKNLWAQSHVFEEKAGREEKLFACISIEGPEDFDGRLVGRKLLNAFEEGYYGFSDTPYKSLVRSLSNISLEISSLVPDSEKLFFDFTAAVFYRGVLYVGVVGAGGAKIYRSGILTDLFRKERSTKENSVASGFVRAGDIFLLYTSSFILDIQTEEIEGMLVNNSYPEISDLLAPYLMKGEKSSTKAVLLLGVVEKEEEAVSNDDLLESQADSLKDEPTRPTEKEEVFEKKNILLERVKEKIGGLRKRKMPTIFLKREGVGRTKKVSFTVGVVLILMLFGSIFLGIRKQGEDVFKSKFAVMYQEARDKYDEGVSLLDLNPALSKMPLEGAKEKAEELLKLTGNKKEKKEVEDLMSKINEALMGAVKTYKVSEPELFYDLTVLGDKAEGSSWSIYEKTALIFDEKNSTAYNVGLTGKSGGLVAGRDDLEGVIFFAMGDKKAYFFGEKGVFETKIGEKGTSLVIKKDEDWGEIVDLTAFGQNLYLLDKTSGKVWKYTGEFQSKSNYFAADIKPDLSKATEMLIDGSVWILTGEGSLLRYTTGRLDPINLSGLSENLGEITTFYIDSDTKYLYILDKVNKRIVLFDKKGGAYYSQYQWEGAGEVSGIAADEGGKKIFLLNGAKIYSIDLK